MTLRSWLVGLTAFGLLTSACGLGSGYGGGVQTSAPSLPTSTPTASQEADTAAISVAQTSLGKILVDPGGFTLYVLTNDTAGQSTCYESCAATWPPVPADTGVGSDVDASLFGSTMRTDGVDQMTIDGRPLYRFAPDASPGDVGGQGINGVWFVVGADGVPIGPSAGKTPSDTTSGYGY